MTDSDPSDYVCDNCGESTHGPLIGGECVRKCSNSVPVEALQELIADIQEDAGYVDQDVNLPDAYANGLETSIERIEALIEDYQ